MNESQIANAMHSMVARIARESDQTLLEQLGIGLAQYKILLSLQGKAKRQQRAIALELGQTEASISRQIKLLAGSSMLVTSKNPNNLREHQAKLTNKGLRITEAAEKVLRSYHELVFSGLSDKQLQQLGTAVSLFKP